jgi:O-acetyl-ADP-ribose deacetylase (regulator of RNase III)
MNKFYYEQVESSDPTIRNFKPAFPQPRNPSRIKVVHGNVLDIKEGIIVHGCNCFGAMGAGIALQIKKQFPAAYDVYSKIHDEFGLKLGNICIAEVGNNKYIINANTQQVTGIDKRQVSYEAIATCFEKVLLQARFFKEDHNVILPIVFPMIGAGLGGGNWNIIETIIDETIDGEFETILYKFP